MWYSVRDQFRSEIQGDTDPYLWEECVFVMQAPSDEAAQRKAVDVAKAKQHDYLNDEGETVRWVFVGVEEVQDLCEDETDDGTEVYSRLYFESDKKPDA